VTISSAILHERAPGPAELARPFAILAVSAVDCAQRRREPYRKRARRAALRPAGASPDHRPIATTNVPRGPLGHLMSWCRPYQRRAMRGRTLDASTQRHVTCRALRNQSVDDGSTMAPAAGSRRERCAGRAVECRQDLAYAQRRRGTRRRKDRWIFVDADTVVPAAVVRASLGALARGAAGGGASLEFDGRSSCGGGLMPAIASSCA